MSHSPRRRLRAGGQGGLKPSFPPTACLSVVGWVKRDVGKINVGFAHLNPPQQIEKR